jgi:erythronate-4-phosphate dehydrogenase
MKIVADEQLLTMDHCFDAHTDLIVKPGRTIAPADLFDADILLVRAVTEVNASLLQNTKVQYVGSLTTGTDHLDIDYLDKHHIAWFATSGFNALPVAEYVITVVAALIQMAVLPNTRCRVGIVGAGKIGMMVAERFKALDYEVIFHDPLRALAEPDFVSTPLTEFGDIDIVTLHVPFTMDGLHPTFHMVDKYFLQRMKKNAVLINASRGSVVDFSALKQYGHHLNWCLDVWENEPLIDCDIVQHACIATPHIAGYSVQSRVRGIDMLFNAPFLHAFQKPVRAVADIKNITLTTGAWFDVLLENFDPRDISAEMKTMYKDIHHCSQLFDGLRKGFTQRYEWSHIHFEYQQLSLVDQHIMAALLACS